MKGKPSKKASKKAKSGKPKFFAQVLHAPPYEDSKESAEPAPMHIRDLITQLAVDDALKKERQKNAESSGKKKLGVAPNMAAAAARTGLHPDAVKEAKARGCTAFHQSGRVDCDALLEYAIANPKLLEQDDGKPNMQLEQALLIRTNRLIREQKLLDIRNKNITRAEMGQRLRALGLEQKAILEKELKGNPKLVARICALMRALVDSWKE